MVLLWLQRPSTLNSATLNSADHREEAEDILHCAMRHKDSSQLWNMADFEFVLGSSLSLTLLQGSCYRNR